MPSDDARDIYRRFEIEVRTPATRLLVDAFLPAPESIETALAAPAPPPPLPGEEGFGRADDIGPLARTDREEEPDAPPSRPRRRPAAPPKKPARAKSLQEEIEEFMSRDGRATLAPEEDVKAEPAGGDGTPGTDGDIS